MEVIRGNCDQWIGSAQKILHVDFHSGLGGYGEYKLMLAEIAGSEQCRWYEKVFGRDSVRTPGRRSVQGDRHSRPLAPASILRSRLSVS